MDVQVFEIDAADESVQRSVCEFLAPHETHCLFIIGNMKRRFPGSHLYLATRGNQWAGLAGYYDLFHSVMPFALDPEAVQALVRHIAHNHSRIEALGAVAAVAAPAYEALKRLGYALVSNPRCAFMELDTPPPPQAYESQVRLMAPADYASVAVLFRHLHGTPPDAPITEEEIRTAAANPLCYVLEIDKEIVSTASTNGLGISAFQILGVSTLPDHRNRGYARAVCAALIRALWAQGARRCILFTEFDNVAAHSCYRKLGFATKTEYWLARLTHSTAALP